MTAGGAGMTVNMAARLTVMEAASIDSGLRRNDGWCAGMTAGGAGMTVNMAARPTVMESASIDSGLRRNDGWGRWNDGECDRTA